MKKIIFQGAIFVVVFLGAWFLLSTIAWVKLFNIRNISNSTEKKLGKIFYELYQKNEVEIKNEKALNAIDSIVTQICTKNKIERKLIKIHILKNDEINAFALPDGHLIIYSGLIQYSDNESELCGVLCHELAHIQLNHVMKKLIKEVGLNVLMSTATGQGGSETIKETATILSSTAFDRDFEKEADIKAVDYMLQANVNPSYMADFLYKLSQIENQTNEKFTWLSTHPESKERAAYIIEYSKGKKVQFKSILNMKTWNDLKNNLTL